MRSLIQKRAETSTLIAAVRLDGACAPWLFEGAMDGEMFLAWVRQGLVTTLQPGELVIIGADEVATFAHRPVKTPAKSHSPIHPWLQ